MISPQMIGTRRKKIRSVQAIRIANRVEQDLEEDAELKRMLREVELLEGTELDSDIDEKDGNEFVMHREIDELKGLVLLASRRAKAVAAKVGRAEKGITTLQCLRGEIDNQVKEEEDITLSSSLNYEEQSGVVEDNQSSTCLELRKKRDCLSDAIAVLKEMKYDCMRLTNRQKRKRTRKMRKMTDDLVADYCSYPNYSEFGC